MSLTSTAPGPWGGVSYSYFFFERGAMGHVLRLALNSAFSCLSLHGTGIAAWATMASLGGLSGQSRVCGRGTCPLLSGSRLRLSPGRGWGAGGGAGKALASPVGCCLFCRWSLCSTMAFSNRDRSIPSTQVSSRALTTKAPPERQMPRP